MTRQVEFDKALEPTDYGLIVCGKTGKLKGVWIPTGLEDTPVPESIVRMCVEQFGIDPDEFDDEQPSIH